MPESTVDPRASQSRYASTPSGRLVPIRITGDDRLSALAKVTGGNQRWLDVMKARESGLSIEDIQIKLHVRLPVNEHCQGSCEPPCLKCWIASIYAALETELFDVAQARAKLLP